MSGPHDEDPGGYEPPPNQFATWAVLGIAVVLVGSLFGIRAEHQPETTREYRPRALMADAEPVLLPAPEIDDEYMPCDDCHEGEPTNRTPRVLEDDHEDQEMAHGDLWCLHCHDADQKESLHLADGTLVAFENSWQLCTQCHAKKLPDWRAGVHGKRTGHWRGEKEYRTCVVCHEPHAPSFPPMAPESAPPRPEEMAGAAERPAPKEDHHEGS